MDDHYNDGYTGQKTTDRDDTTYHNSFDINTAASYSDSLDVIASIDPSTGWTVFSGTNGNNLINMSGSNSFAAYTGGGNDTIIGGSNSSEVLMIDGAGKKAIIEPGTGYDLVNIMTIDSIYKVILTYVGNDLYITSSDSSFVPEDDPNAIVIIGHILYTSGNPNSNVNSVETIMTADGYGFDLYAHPYGLAGSRNYSSGKLELFEQASGADANGFRAS